jgi:hypothetical protein
MGLQLKLFVALAASVLLANTCVFLMLGLLGTLARRKG